MEEHLRRTKAGTSHRSVTRPGFVTEISSDSERFGFLDVRVLDFQFVESLFQVRQRETIRVRNQDLNFLFEVDVERTGLLDQGRTDLASSDRSCDARVDVVTPLRALALFLADGLELHAQLLEGLRDGVFLQLRTGLEREDGTRPAHVKVVDAFNRFHDRTGLGCGASGTARCFDDVDDFGRRTGSERRASGEQGQDRDC